VFVQPAAHDAGGAFGACLYAWYEKDQKAHAQRLRHLYWGADVASDPELKSIFDEWSDFVECRLEADITVRTANLLADGAVVGWVQGRSEFGPRALGNRSILADPRPAENKARINNMVKKREGYRPFAPSVIEGRIGEFFEVPARDPDFPFMIFVLNVKEHVRELLGAVTHTDGTARVQSVSRDTNPAYWRLLHEFGKLTNVPVLLNTSFNNNAEPIVDSAAEAITCFVTTGINYLVIGNYLLTKRLPHEIRQAIYGLVPSLPMSRKLTKGTAPQAGPGTRGELFAIENIKSKYFGVPVTPISADMFHLLGRSTGKEDIATLLQKAQITPDRAATLIDEFMALWEQRVLQMHPRNRQIPRRQAQVETPVFA
jgi:carbamoyltransferase